MVNNDRDIELDGCAPNQIHGVSKVIIIVSDC